MSSLQTVLSDVLNTLFDRSNENWHIYRPKSFATKACWVSDNCIATGVTNIIVVWLSKHRCSSALPGNDDFACATPIRAMFVNRSRPAPYTMFLFARLKVWAICPYNKLCDYNVYSSLRFAPHNMCLCTF